MSTAPRAVSADTEIEQLIKKARAAQAAFERHAYAIERRAQANAGAERQRADDIRQRDAAQWMQPVEPEIDAEQECKNRQPVG